MAITQPSYPTTTEDLVTHVGAYTDSAAQPALTSTGTTANLGTTLTVNFASAAREKRYSGTFNGNLAVTIQNPVAGSMLVIEGVQDATGSRTLTVAGQAITIPTAAAADVAVAVRWYDASTFRWVSAGVETDPALAAHLSDTSDAHDASAISISAITGIAATDVQGALAEDVADLAAHLADTADAHAATAIGFTPNGSIAATTVQAAIQEVRDEASGGSGLSGPITPLWVGKAYLTPAGNPISGSNISNGAGGTAFAQPFIAGRSCTIASIKGQINTAATAGTRFVWLICEDAGGYPGNRVTNAMTGLTAVDATGIVTGTFSTPPSLTAGTRYWLVGYQYDTAAANATWKGVSGNCGNPLLSVDVTNPSVGGSIKWSAGSTLVGIASPPSPLGSSGDWGAASEYMAWMITAAT